MMDSNINREKQEKKEKAKYGHLLEPIKCSVCKQTGGTLVKVGHGIYKHQKKCK